MFKRPASVVVVVVAASFIALLSISIALIGIIAYLFNIETNPMWVVNYILFSIITLIVVHGLWNLEKWARSHAIFIFIATFIFSLRVLREMYPVIAPFVEILSFLAIIYIAFSWNILGSRVPEERIFGKSQDQK